MPVKIGNSYVSDAALAYAQSKVSEGTSNSKNGKSSNRANDMLSELSQQFKDVKFSVGTQPFSGTGTNNISIAPNILRQMANDPDKRLEYEALIYDCANGLKEFGNRPGLKAQGYIIGSDGGLRMWSIGSSDNGKQNRSLMNVDKDRLAGRLPKKKKKTPAQELQEKLLEKSKEDEESTTTKGKTTVTFNESKRSRQLAAAKTTKDIEQLMELLKTDLEDCENGLREGACDEEEVKKVKKMMERAQKKMNEVSDNEDDDTFGHSPIDILI